MMLWWLGWLVWNYGSGVLWFYLLFWVKFWFMNSSFLLGVVYIMVRKVWQLVCCVYQLLGCLRIIGFLRCIILLWLIVSMQFLFVWYMLKKVSLWWLYLWQIGFCLKQVSELFIQFIVYLQLKFKFLGVGVVMLGKDVFFLVIIRQLGVMWCVILFRCLRKVMVLRFLCLLQMFGIYLVCEKFRYSMEVIVFICRLFMWQFCIYFRVELIRNIMILLWLQLKMQVFQLQWQFLCGLVYLQSGELLKCVSVNLLVGKWFGIQLSNMLMLSECKWLIRYLKFFGLFRWLVGVQQFVI